MKRHRLIMKRSFYPIVWTIIVFVAFYLLMRFAILTLSNDNGQAVKEGNETLVSRLCVHMMKSNSSLMGFVANQGELSYRFPENIILDELVLHRYATSQPNVLDAMVNQQAKEVEEQQAIAFHDITKGKLGKEYVISNGSFFPSLSLKNQTTESSDQLQIGFLEGDIELAKKDDQNKDTKKKEEKAIEAMVSSIGNPFTLEQLKNINFLIRNFYIVDGSTRVTDDLFDAEVLLEKDMRIKQKNDAPQILIYHTHTQEAFVDSRPGVKEDTIVGVGTYLAKILEEDYGYHVIHDKTEYDIAGGVEDRNLAYDYAGDSLEKILDENPTIEVMIDLHRDGVGKRVTKINGEETAQIMLFNGLCRDQKGPITRLDNPYLQDNLAFSLQLQLKSLERYPGLFYRNYLKDYRYNLHFRPKSILVELGTHKNTIKAAKNAMKPFAEVLDDVLKGN